MEHIRRIREIASRAAQLGVSLRQLCERSGAPYSSVHRWLSDPDANPTHKKASRAAALIEAQLAAEEQRLKAALQAAAQELAA